MRFAILGAGGVGGYYGAVLAEAGHDVRLLARGEHLQAIRDRGLIVRTPEREFVTRPVPVADTDELSDCDAVLLTVKAYSLQEILPAAARLAREGAVIVPLLNGVDIIQRLGDGGVPSAAVLGGLTYISAFRTAPGIVERRSPFQRVLLGEPDGGASERARRIADAFGGAGVQAEAVPDIALETWKKFHFLCTLSTCCGLSRTLIGPLRESRHGWSLLERAADEIAAVAEAVGRPLPPEAAAATLRMLENVPSDMRPSFLADLERGGPTEVDALTGTVVRLGDEAGVPVPVHATALAAFVAATAA